MNKTMETRRIFFPGEGKLTSCTDSKGQADHG